MKINIPQIYAGIATILNTEANNLGISVSISDQQYFNVMVQDEGMIVVTIDFGDADFDGMQAVVDFTLHGVSEKNSIKIVQDFFTSLANDYTMHVIQPVNGIVILNLPADMQNFQEFEDGFRASFDLSGTITIQEGGVIPQITIDGEQVKYLQFGADTTNTPDPQATVDSQALNLTLIQSSTDVLTLMGYYMSDSNFCSNLMKSFGGTREQRKRTYSVTMSVAVANGTYSVQAPMVVSKASFGRNIAGYMTYSVTMTTGKQGGQS